MVAAWGRGALMVRQLEPSSAPTVQIALDFRIRDPLGDRYEPDELEFAISVAASLSAYGAARKWRLGPDGERPLGGSAYRRPAVSSSLQLEAILSVLARASSAPRGTLSDLLSRHCAQHQGRSAVIVITADLDDDAVAVLHTHHVLRAGALRDDGAGRDGAAAGESTRSDAAVECE